jgi:transposase InsO family protein
LAITAFLALGLLGFDLSETKLRRSPQAYRQSYTSLSSSQTGQSVSATRVDVLNKGVPARSYGQALKSALIIRLLERAKEQYPGVRPRVISDNGPQFIAKDFKEFIRISGMTHVRTSPYYPQSNGKIERWHQSLKGECIRPGTPLPLEDARCLVKGYVEHYNNVRLNSAIGYIT